MIDPDLVSPASPAHGLIAVETEHGHALALAVRVLKGLEPAVGGGHVEVVGEGHRQENGELVVPFLLHLRPPLASRLHLLLYKVDGLEEGVTGGLECRARSHELEEEAIGQVAESCFVAKTFVAPLEGVEELQALADGGGGQGGRGDQRPARLYAAAEHTQGGDLEKRVSSEFRVIVTPGNSELVALPCCKQRWCRLPAAPGGW